MYYNLSEMEVQINLARDNVNLIRTKENLNNSNVAVHP